MLCQSNLIKNVRPIFTAHNIDSDSFKIWNKMTIQDCKIVELPWG